MKATDVSPLLNRDGVYRLVINPAHPSIETRKVATHEGREVATLAIVQAGELYAVHLEPVTEPAAFLQAIDTEAVTVMRLVDEA